MLKHAFGASTEGIYLHTRSDGKLFNVSRLKAKTKIREVLIRDLLFADDAALTAHQEDHLESLMNRFSKACEDFRLTISLKKTNIMNQDTESPPSIAINNYQLEVITEEFTYLGSTVTDSLDMGPELNRRIGRATSIVARLSKRVWENHKLTTNTKMAARLQSLCPEHPPVRQRVVDPIRTGRKAAQHLPHAETEADPGNQVVGSNHQQ